MSFHDHETEEYNKRLGVEERQKQEQQKRSAQQSIDADVQDDLMMLDRLQEFDLNEREIKNIRHLIGLPDGKGIPFLINYIQGRTGSAILHYESKFIKNLPVGKFNERNY